MGELNDFMGFPRSIVSFDCRDMWWFVMGMMMGSKKDNQNMTFKRDAFFTHVRKSDSCSAIISYVMKLDRRENWKVYIFQIGKIKLIQCKIKFKKNFDNWLCHRVQTFFMIIFIIITSIEVLIPSLFVIMISSNWF